MNAATSRPSRSGDRGSERPTAASRIARSNQTSFHSVAAMAHEGGRATKNASRTRARDRSPASAQRQKRRSAEVERRLHPEDGRGRADEATGAAEQEGEQGRVQVRVLTPQPLLILEEDVGTRPARRERDTDAQPPRGDREKHRSLQRSRSASSLIELGEPAPRSASSSAVDRRPQAIDDRRRRAASIGEDRVRR